MDHRILEPVGQIACAAAVAFRRGWLAFAFAAAGRTFDADMEVIVVPVHRPDLGKPATVALGLAAQRFLDRSVDKYTLHARPLQYIFTII